MIYAQMSQAAPMDHDKFWTAYSEWEDLEELLTNPHQYVESLSDARGAPLHASLPLGETITAIFLYPEEVPETLPAGTSMVVVAKNISTVVIADIIDLDTAPPDNYSVDGWMPQGSYIVMPDGTDVNLPAGGTLVTEGRQITIPPGNQVIVTLRPKDGIGYVHFPIAVSKSAALFSAIIRNPQSFAGALDAYARANADDPQKYVVEVVPGTEIDGGTPKVNFVQLSKPQLSRFRAVYQASCPDGYYNCSASVGSLVRVANNEFNFILNTAGDFCYRL